MCTFIVKYKHVS